MVAPAEAAFESFSVFQYHPCRQGEAGQPPGTQVFDHGELLEGKIPHIAQNQISDLHFTDSFFADGLILRRG